MQVSLSFGILNAIQLLKTKYHKVEQVAPDPKLQITV